jgi:predicted ABC-type ATPase
VIGGPNGAGKTTSSNRILPGSVELRHFLNADEIARKLSPSDPDSAAVAAGRLLLEGMTECTRSGISFAFETTCAGRAHLQRLRLCRSAGYRITLIFLWLPSPDVALARVAQRVANGGHAIPRDVVIRQFRTWACSDHREAPTFIAHNSRFSAMATDRGGDRVTEVTSHQIVENVLRALKETARDVDERRVRLDGRVTPESYATRAAPVIAAPTPVTAK